jgi:hypothetical protein
MTYSYHVLMNLHLCMTIVLCSDVWVVQIHQVIFLHVPAPYAPMATSFTIGSSVCGQTKRHASHQSHARRQIDFLGIPILCMPVAKWPSGQVHLLVHG